MLTMAEIDTLFMDSVEAAVAASLQQHKPLVVYCTGESGDNRWLTSWIAEETSKAIADKCVALKLLKGSEQFGYFEQLFPSVSVPSVYCVSNGQILTIIRGNDGIETFNQNLLECVPGAKTSNTQGKKEPSRDPGFKKTLKEQIAETASQKHQEQLMKQRKIELEERERIIRLVRADKEERRARERAMHQMPVQETREVQDNIKRSLHTDTCTLLIRLTSGHSLTHEFRSKETLNDVRKWLDVNRTDGDTPYSFHRNIPRITFNESQELKTLEQLELTPRSALILKPIELFDGMQGHRVVDAQGPGLLGKVVNGIFSWWGNGESTSIESTVREKTSADQDKSSRPATNHVDDAMSPTSSMYSSPLHSPYLGHLEQNPSELSLPSRCVSPKVYQFVNTQNNDEVKDRSTYNGNNVNLEDKKKNKDE